MRRWFYILLGGIGISLSAAAAFMLWLSPSLPPPYPLRVQIGECAMIVVGVVLGVVGFVNGREAGEFGGGLFSKSPRQRDHHVIGQEIEFKCPSCSKVYRASPLLAGKKFSCRDCNQVFEVSTAATLTAQHPSAV